MDRIRLMLGISLMFLILIFIFPFLIIYLAYLVLSDIRWNITGQPCRYCGYKLNKEPWITTQYGESYKVCPECDAINFETMSLGIIGEYI